jgi:hypothetical protein
MELADVIALLTETWPRRLEKGRVIHIAINAHRLPDGSTVHVRVLIQRTADPHPTVEGLDHVSLD